MTSKSKTASAVVALASLVAGASMAAIAIHVQAEDLAWNEAGSLTQGSPSESPGTRHLLPGPPRGDVEIGPITYRLEQLPVAKSLSAVRSRVKQTCVPYWRALVEGPAGRMVATTCPGAPVPPPPPNTEPASRLQRLPTLEDFANPLPLRALRGANPSPDRALAAARSVAGSLGERRVVAKEPAAPREELLPTSNPLGWHACPPAERSSSNKSGGVNRC
jgi:hypothetical protein